MKKAFYLHGFLGGPEDMRPLFLEGYEIKSVDLRKYLEHKDIAEALSQEFRGGFDFAFGYSFGGRVLARILNKDPGFSKKWFFASSRHSSYSVKEIKDRELFKRKLLSSLAFGLEDFHLFWSKLGLFSGHRMDVYRENYELPFPAWTSEEITLYLENHFTYKNRLPPDNKNAYYLYGDKDDKYTREAKSVKNFFKVIDFEGRGHRFLFESPEDVKEKIEEVL